MSNWDNFAVAKPFATIINWLFELPRRFRKMLFDLSVNYLSKYNPRKDVLSLEVGRENIVRMKDGRKFFYNEKSRIDSLYSIPFSGMFEKYETNLCRILIGEGGVCVDVGASFGWYSTLFSLLAGSCGKVHSFEPVAKNFHSLQRNLILNNVGNVVANNIALGDFVGRSKIFLSDIDTSGSLQLRDYHKTYSEEEIAVTTLDNYVANTEIGSIDFIKADIEGAEMMMLHGAVGVLRNHCPILFLEIQAHSTRLFGYEPGAIFKFLAEFGYEGYVIRGGKLLRVEGAENHKDYNYFFLNRKKLDMYKDVILPSVDFSISRVSPNE